jgi:hypothetical protein
MCIIINLCVDCLINNGMICGYYNAYFNCCDMKHFLMFTNNIKGNHFGIKLFIHGNGFCVVTTSCSYICKPPDLN